MLVCTRLLPLLAVRRWILFFLRFFGYENDKICRVFFLLHFSFRWISIGNGGGRRWVVKLSTATNTFFFTQVARSRLLSRSLHLSTDALGFAFVIFFSFFSFFANAARLSLSLQLQHSSLLLREGGRQLLCCGCWLKLTTKNKTIKKNIHPICNNLCCTIRTHTHHNSFDFLALVFNVVFVTVKKFFLAEATQTRRVAKMC